MGHDDGERTIWDVQAGVLRRVLLADFLPVPDGYVRSAWVAFVPNTPLLATAWGGWCGVRLANALTGREERWIGGARDPIAAIAASAQGLLAWASATDLWVWDVGRERFVASARHHEAPIRTLTFSPDGTVMISGGHDGRVVFWEPSTCIELSRIRCEDRALYADPSVAALAVNPLGDLLAVALDWQIDVQKLKVQLEPVHAHETPQTSAVAAG